MKYFFQYLLAFAFFGTLFLGCGAGRNPGSSSKSSTPSAEAKKGSEKAKPLITFTSYPRVVVEAESATTVKEPVRIVQTPDASAGQCIEIPEGAGKPPKVGGSATYEIDIPKDGDYILWLRTWWDDGCGNTVFAVIDDGEQMIVGGDGTYKHWHWVKLLKPLRLQQGTIKLVLKNREDGVKIDQILLTQDTQYVPQAIETVAPPSK